MTLDQREFVLVEQFTASQAGFFVAFVTKGDGHSPVMIERYEALKAELENRIPLVFMDAEDPANAALVTDCFVWSVPTLIWLMPSGQTVTDRNHRLANYPQYQVVMRMVGTVLERKLFQEADAVIDALE